MKQDIVDNVAEVPCAIILNDKKEKENIIFTDFAENRDSEVFKKKKMRTSFR